MRDLVEVFHNTRLLVLSAMTAALYAIILVLFKGLVIVPVITELRLAPFVPCLFSFLFGPAAAWGAAIGNLVGDILGGTLSPGSLFGFLANFMFGYLPYQLWQGLFRERPTDAHGASVFPKAIVCCLGASAVCAVIVGYGVDILGLAPGPIVTFIVVINNASVGGILAAILLPLLAPRARRLRLTYPELLQAGQFRRRATDTAISVVVMLSSLAGVGGAAVAVIRQAGVPIEVIGVSGLVAVAASCGLPSARGKRPLAVRPAMPGLASESARSAIELREVSFTYETDQAGAADRGGRPALGNVSLEITAGEWVVVMGASGAGKTTLCRLLNRLIPEQIPGQLAGSVAILGQPIDGLGVGDLSAHVGMVFEDFEAQLVASTPELEVALPLESMGMSVEAMRQRVPEVLSLVGFEQPPDRPMDAYSGGERQRLSLAAVLAPSPPILVLDEVTTDLDPAGREHLIDLLRELKACGVTVVMVEHDVELARCADRVVLLHEGQVLRDGPPGEVLSEIVVLRQAGVRPPSPCVLMEILGRTERPVTPGEAIRTLGHGDSFVPALPAAPDKSDEIVLEVASLSHAYGETQTLADVSLSVHRGEQVAIIGQNGSGKTTLAKHFNGLLTPQAGTVRVLGRSVEEWDAAELGRKVAYVFQNPDHQIFAGTVEEEVAFGPRNLGMSGERLARSVAQALAAVGLRGREQDDPFALSRGERQRLALASALACAPEILVLDEPTTGLDARQQEGMIELIEQLRQEGMTVIFITHAMYWVERCADRVVILHQGRVVADGRPRSVFAETERLAEWGLRPPDLAMISAWLGWPDIPRLSSGVTPEKGGGDLR